MGQGEASVVGQMGIEEIVGVLVDHQPVTVEGHHPMGHGAVRNGSGYASGRRS